MAVVVVLLWLGSLTLLKTGIELGMQRSPRVELGMWLALAPCLAALPIAAISLRRRSDQRAGRQGRAGSIPLAAVAVVLATLGASVAVGFGTLVFTEWELAFSFARYRSDVDPLDQTSTGKEAAMQRAREDVALTHGPVRRYHACLGAS